MFMLPDFRVRQRDYLLEITRAITQELDLQKVLKRILRISIEMLAGQAGIVALKETRGWRVVAPAASRISTLKLRWPIESGVTPAPSSLLR